MWRNVEECCDEEWHFVMCETVKYPEKPKVGDLGG